MSGYAKKILILGATGRTGKFIPKIAIEAGYEVVCLVRDQTKIKPRQGLIVLQGDVSKKTDLKNAAAGCQAVISVLNISRINDFPWSPLRTPKKFLSETMKIIIEVARDLKINHVVSCSAWGVGNSRKDIPFWFRWLIDNSKIRYAYDDHEDQEAILRNSVISYTIVRPSGLTNGKKLRKIRRSFDNSPKPSLLINRYSVAHFLLKCIKEPGLINKTVTVSAD